MKVISFGPEQNYVHFTARQLIMGNSLEEEKKTTSMFLHLQLTKRTKDAPQKYPAIDIWALSYHLGTSVLLNILSYLSN